jgi:hypothetical protein
MRNWLQKEIIPFSYVETYSLSTHELSESMNVRHFVDETVESAVWIHSSLAASISS